MKNLITILMCAFCLAGMMAQNEDGPGRTAPPPTPQIQALYAQERTLKAAGDVAGLEINRAAIITAWQAIDPEIAAEFKPIQLTEPVTPYIPNLIQTRPNVPYNNNPEWDTDLLLNAGFNDGVDIETALNGTIYVAAYENRIRYGVGNDEIHIYKSTDNGVSFNEWGSASVPDDIRKMKLTLMDNDATKYLFTTYSSAGGILQNLRFNLAGGPLDSQTITNNVLDFDIDVDYEFSSDAQLYAVYIKGDNAIYSALSAASSYGFDWLGEHSFGLSARACAFTYGRGSTYVSFVGFNTGNLYFASNTGFNNPAGWDTPFVITDGAVRESTDLSLTAERKIHSQYRVLALASQRITGSTDQYIGVAMKIQDNGTATPEDIVTLSGSVRAWDSWSEKANGNDIIKTSFAIVASNVCRVKNYHNWSWDNSEIIADNPITAQRGSSAVAGDENNNAIAAYIGTNSTGLYFDSNSNTAGVNNNALSSFEYYPNPANSILNLKAASSISNVAIYNLLGQELLIQKPDALTSEINVSGLSNGTYIMKVTIGSETGTYKIIKN